VIPEVFPVFSDGSYAGPGALKEAALTLALGAITGWGTRVRKKKTYYDDIKVHNLSDM